VEKGLAPIFVDIFVPVVVAIFVVADDVSQRVRTTAKAMPESNTPIIRP
jgi:hypothetical protein